MDDKKTGRPHKGQGPSFPADEVDRLLVHGEPVEVTDGQLEGVRFPSYRELGERYGVAHTLIARYSTQHNCLERRKRAQKQVKHLSDEKLIELRATAVAFSRDDQLRTTEKYLLQYEQALEEGRVRTDNPSDFNQMCRLHSFLLGEADSRQEVQNGMPTLEDLQRGHKEMMDTWNNATAEERELLPEYLYGFDGAARQRAARKRQEEAEAAEAAEAARLADDDDDDVLLH